MTGQYGLRSASAATPPPPGFLIQVVGRQAPTVQRSPSDWRYRIQFVVKHSEPDDRANYIGYAAS